MCDSIKYNTAMLDLEAAKERLRPSVIRPVKVLRDGSAWSCSLYWPEAMEQLVEYGDTPEEACKAFDRAWIGTQS